MTAITIALPDELIRKLNELAAQNNMSVDELVRLGLEGLMTVPDDDLTTAIDYLLQKNAELYKRLAA